MRIKYNDWMARNSACSTLLSMPGYDLLVDVLHTAPYYRQPVQQVALKPASACWT
jgi:hypothetical protein